MSEHEAIGGLFLTIIIYYYYLKSSGYLKKQINKNLLTFILLNLIIYIIFLIPCFQYLDNISYNYSNNFGFKI